MEESQKQVAVFFTLIVFIIVAVAVLWFFNLLTIMTILILVLIVLIVTYYRMHTFFVQLQEYERAVVFRMGKFRKIVGPGWVLLIPFIESYKKIDLRERTVDIGAQEVITRDNIKLLIDAIIYLKVSDPKAAIINVLDYERASVSFTQAHLRDVAGKMELDKMISRVDEVNAILQEGLQRVTKDWGILIDKVEIQSIELPPEVISAMHKRKAAEQYKFAAVEEAEARKIHIDAIQAAAGKLTDPTLHYLYLQSLERMAEGKSTKFIFPMELSKLAAGLASRLGEPYAKAERDVISEYQDRLKKGERPDTIIESLQKEIGIPKEVVKPKVKKKKTRAKPKKRRVKRKTRKTKRTKKR